MYQNCLLHHGWLSVGCGGPSKDLRISSEPADPNQNYWQPCPWIVLTAYTFILTIYPYLLNYPLLFSLDSTEQPSFTPLPLQTAHTANHLTQYITMFYSLSTLLRVLVASAATIPFVAAQNQTDMITTKQLMETSYPLQQHHPGTMLEEAVSSPTMSMLSTTGSSFFSTLEELLSLKSQSQNLFKAPFSTGAAILPSLTSATARMRVTLDVVLQ